MSRQQVTFRCEGEILFGSVDHGTKSTGLLLISGGNEIRSGAFCGQAKTAAKIAQAGYAVFRFDRRGVGDSSGNNGGFRQSAPDISAAVAAFREQCPHVKSIVGFGNCDAASALMLTRGAQFGALALANPWTFDDEESDVPPPADAIRARYAQRLRNPREWLRLLSGGVNLRKLAGGLLAASKPAPPVSSLAIDIQQGLAQFNGPVQILLAMRDRTAQAFAASWPVDDRIRHRTDADHAFSDPADQQWLIDQILAALHEQAG